MATTTPNLGLVKPELQDNFNLKLHLNDNWDKIDVFCGSPDAGERVTVVQETGDSESAVMSQKAVTDVFENTFEVHKCSNLFNGEYAETETVDGLSITYTGGVASGYTINDSGVVISEEGSYITYPIKVEEGTTVYFKAASTQIKYGIGYCVFYNKNMSFISKVTATNTKVDVPIGTVYLRLVSTPSTAAWFTKSYKTVSTDSTAGSTYVPYYETYYTTLDEDLRTEFEATEHKQESVNALSHEYLVNYVESLKKELDDLRNYVREKNPPTVLDSGKCGENLTWTLYSDGLLKISGTGRSYDYVKGTMIGKTRAEIEEYTTNSSDEIVKKHYGFQEGKTYDDEHGQYVAPWYRYRPEPEIGTGGYTTEEIYNSHNPHGYKYNRIEIDEGITYLGDWLFYRVCGATELTIPEGVTTIGRWCIRFCTSLITISLPNTLTTIEEYGISRHETSLKAIKFGNSLTTIGASAFNNNDALVSLVLPDSVQSIGNNICEGCDNLKYVDVGGVIEISSSAFANCGNLEEIIIPTTVTTIGANSLFGCHSLKTLHIPESVTLYKSHNLPNLQEVYIDSATVTADTKQCDFGMANASKPKYVNIREDITTINATFLTYYKKCGTFKGYTLYVLK